mgnify:CR=1 FL=1
MSRASLAIKAELFPVKFDDKENYIDVSKIKNRKKTGYMQGVMQAENEIIERAIALRGARSNEAIKDYYEWLDTYVYDFYTPLLPKEEIKFNLPRCKE